MATSGLDAVAPSLAVRPHEPDPDHDKRTRERAAEHEPSPGPPREDAAAVDAEPPEPAAVVTLSKEARAALEAARARDGGP